MHKPNLCPAPPRVAPSSRCSNRPPCWKHIAQECIVWMRVSRKQWIFKTISKPNICSPGSVSCPYQCFQTSLQLSTSSNQSGRVSCRARSSGWRCPPANINMEEIYEREKCHNMMCSSNSTLVVASSDISDHHYQVIPIVFNNICPHVPFGPFSWIETDVVAFSPCYHIFTSLS